jgi:CRP-like cAMP-binding protein
MSAHDLSPHVNTLAGSVVFEHLTPADLDVVLGSCRLLQIPPGQLLLSEGKPGGGLYVILEGNVEVFLPARMPTGGQRPSRVRLNVLGPGRCIGEYGLIDDGPSSASAQAVDAVRVCLLPTTEFRRITEQYDRIGRLVYANLLRFLVGRLRSKDRELDLLFVDEPPRRT